MAHRILDESRFEARARVGDVLALGLLVIVGGALIFNMYTLGASVAAAAQAGGDLVLRRDRAFVSALIEIVLIVASLGWIVYRLFSRSHRRAGG